MTTRDDRNVHPILPSTRRPAADHDDPAAVARGWAKCGPVNAYAAPVSPLPGRPVGDGSELAADIAARCDWLRDVGGELRRELATLRAENERLAVRCERLASEGRAMQAERDEAIDAAAGPGLTGAFRDVAAFMRAVDQEILDLPVVPMVSVELLRRRLIREEWRELDDAIRDFDLPGIADGCADLIYVVIGTALAYGIALPEVWDAVQRANLTKSSGPIRADGKRGKPPGFRPPDVAGILAGQRPLSETYPGIVAPVEGRA